MFEGSRRLSLRGRRRRHDGAGRRDRDIGRGRRIVRRNDRQVGRLSPALRGIGRFREVGVVLPIASLQEQQAQERNMDGQDGENGDADVGLAPWVRESALRNEWVGCVHFNSLARFRVAFFLAKVRGDPKFLIVVFSSAIEAIFIPG